MAKCDGEDRVAGGPAEAQSLSQPTLAADAQEGLAIGGGKAKALADAASAALGRLKNLNPNQLRGERVQTAARMRPAHCSANPDSLPPLEIHPMTQPDQNNPGQAGGNGHRDGGSPHRSSSGTAFTEPTPGGKEKTVAQLFGEIVWLFSQSPKHKNFFVSDLEWLVMTPILLKQFRVFYAPDRPIGVALWGYVSDEVEQRLMSGHARLAPPDWKSGETLWLVDIVAPYGGHDAMIKDLKDIVFPERPIRFLAFGPQGAQVKAV